ncbi:MAG: DUF6471 domain-containing protein [Candidatus Binataceae bacterium]|jgi:hypothetical protein
MDWENEARRIFKSELVRNGLTYELLALRLQGMGVRETPGTIANKMARGKFSFVFFLQCMNAMGTDTVSFRLVGASPPSATRLAVP